MRIFIRAGDNSLEFLRAIFAHLLSYFLAVRLGLNPILEFVTRQPFPQERDR